MTPVEHEKSGIFEIYSGARYESVLNDFFRDGTWNFVPCSAPEERLIGFTFFRVENGQETGRQIMRRI